MTREIPKQRVHLPHSTDQGDYDAYHERCDIEPLKRQLTEIADHVREAWDDDEIEPALLALCEASIHLTRFSVLAQAHRDRVLGT